MLSAQTDTPPSPTTLATALAHPLYDSTGNPTTLSSILPSTQRALVIFIRNFLCGNCQQFLIMLTQLLPPSSLPADLSIVIVGCGAPSLLESYNEIVQCPYPIFTDPTGKLYSVLGCEKTLSLGSKSPDYIQHNLLVGALKSIVQGIRRVPTGDALSAGDMSIVGGEFLFIRTGTLEQEKKPVEGEESGGWRVSWCHRMRNTRDHTEIPDLKTMLDMTPATTSHDSNTRPMSPPLRRATTSTLPNLRRALSKRSQSFVQNINQKRSNSTFTASNPVTNASVTKTELGLVAEPESMDSNSEAKAEIVTPLPIPSQPSTSTTQSPNAAPMSTPTPVRRSTTTTEKMPSLRRAMSKRSQSWVQSLTRSNTVRTSNSPTRTAASGASTDAVDGQRPTVRKFHSQTASVQILAVTTEAK